MPPLRIEEEIDAMNSGGDSYDEPMSTEILEDIHSGSQSHTNINRRESRYIIRDSIKKRQSEWKLMLKATQNTGKGLHKAFSTVVKYISQY